MQKCLGAKSGLGWMGANMWTNINFSQGEVVKDQDISKVRGNVLHQCSEKVEGVLS